MSGLFRFSGLAACMLPLLGLGLSWSMIHNKAQSGTEWQVPIKGYDPVDYLRGHYVQFTYDWPKADNENDRSWNEMCLIGQAPKVIGIHYPTLPHSDGQPPCANYVQGNGGRFNRGQSIDGGRLFASEAESKDLQTKLSDPKLIGTIHFRLRPDGHITPLRITFSPRT